MYYYNLWAWLNALYINQQRIYIALLSPLQGFVARSPSALPPLDPYVEIDQNIPAIPPHSNGWPTAPNITFNGRDHAMVMQNGTVVSNRHDHALQNGARHMVNGSTSPVRRRSANSTPTNSCRLVPRGMEEEVSSAPAVVNYSTDSSSSSSSSSDSGVVDSDAAKQSPPPLTSKGKHMCPRCARRFPDQKVFQQHKDRCLS